MKQGFLIVKDLLNFHIQYSLFPLKRFMFTLIFCLHFSNQSIWTVICVLFCFKSWENPAQLRVSFCQWHSLTGHTRADIAGLLLHPRKNMSVPHHIN